MIGNRLITCFNSLSSISNVTLRSLDKAHSSNGLSVLGCCQATGILPGASRSPSFLGAVTSQTMPLHQQRSFSTSHTNFHVPPNRDRPFIDYYMPRIKIRKARKCADPVPKPHRFRDIQRSWNLREIPQEEEARELHNQLAPAVVEKVNKQLEEGRAGRLFAVVSVGGKQHLVKTEDIIVMEGNYPLKLGEVIRLQKVLAMGGRDFTLLGRPILPVDQAFVEATVIEKTFSHTKIWFLTKPRKNIRVTRFIREPLTYMRINSVCVLNKVDDLPDVRGVEGKVFGNKGRE